jgi:bifunctional UDP-N-acetylglucosamine pyrophosphorylase/glucosamine-1-phosphate N-acetyltransferase
VLSVEAVILAAGQGTRMKSRLPKVLHQLAGKPLLAHVLDAARQLGIERMHTIIGHGAEQVESCFAGCADISWVIQQQQLGTGHAVLQAMPQVDPNSIVLILYGDVPLLRSSTLQQLVDAVSDRAIGLLTVELQDPTGYGRILRDGNGRVFANVEQKDATDEQKQVREVNTGILAVKASDLNRWLPGLSKENSQGEYYLTDIIALAADEGYVVECRQPGFAQEVEGVNSRSQLAALERWFQLRQAEDLMAGGVTLYDPARLDIRGNLSTGSDVTVDINVVFEGDVSIGNGVSIGPNCVISNAVIGDNVAIYANSIIDDAVVEDNASIGPFARLRPGTVLKSGAKIGNFVETKKAEIGVGAKVNHLSYIGDSTIGARVNIGAGTITCNYDGVNKHQTLIEQDVFIGSNTSIVAPVKVGQGATIGAGSTITTDVGANQLAVARGRQRNHDGWARPKKKIK